MAKCACASLHKTRCNAVYSGISSTPIISLSHSRDHNLRTLAQHLSRDCNLCISRRFCISACCTHLQPGASGCTVTIRIGSVELWGVKRAPLELLFVRDVAGAQDVALLVSCLREHTRIHSEQLPDASGISTTQPRARAERILHAVCVPPPSVAAAALAHVCLRRRRRFLLTQDRVLSPATKARWSRSSSAAWASWARARWPRRWRAASWLKAS